MSCDLYFQILPTLPFHKSLLRFLEAQRFIQAPQLQSGNSKMRARLPTARAVSSLSWERLLEKRDPGLCSVIGSKTAASQSNGAGVPPSLELGSSLSPPPVDGAGPGICLHVARVGVRQVAAQEAAQTYTWRSAIPNLASSLSTYGTPRNRPPLDHLWTQFQQPRSLKSFGSRG